MQHNLEIQTIFVMPISQWVKISPHRLTNACYPQQGFSAHQNSVLKEAGIFAVLVKTVEP